ncbi:MAG: hypothetical protein U1C55_02195 [Smithellaceae bacterium]|nr:hypothetical protein [Smithellaceae bacterium]
MAKGRRDDDYPLLVIKNPRRKYIFRFNRGLEPGQYGLADVFADIRTCGILLDIFADAEEFAEVMDLTKVIVADSPYEIFVNNDDGSINIGLTHLRQTSDEFLYLDIIHELCHVKQHRQGRNLYDRSKAYVDRETEIEAYELTVREARRIGLDDNAISGYLRVSWITAEEHQRLSRRLQVVLSPLLP